MHLQSQQLRCGRVARGESFLFETPFSFAFAGDNQLIITNAYGGNAGQSVITSQTIGDNGITCLSSAVPLNKHQHDCPAVRGIEQIDFMWYLKKIGWLALIGFAAAIFVFLLQRQL